MFYALKRILSRSSLLGIGIYLLWVGYQDKHELSFILLWTGLAFTLSGTKIFLNERFLKSIFSKKIETKKVYTSAKENPNLTRFRRKYCSNCNNTSEHEIARTSDKSDRAYVTCSSCGSWKEISW